MLKNQYQHIKLKIKIGFCFSIFIILTAATYQVYSIWHENYRSTSLEISHSVRMANILVEDALIDGSKLLDIAKLDLKNIQSADKKNNQDIEHSLKRSVSKFKVSSWFNVYGNLLYVDALGNVLAQTDGPLKRQINVADRYYYQALKAQNGEAIVISPEVVGKSNGRYVFHLASSITNNKGGFIGLLVIQVNSLKFKNDIASVLGDGYESMGLYLANGKLIFSLGDHKSNPSSASIYDIMSEKSPADAVLIPSNKFLEFGQLAAGSEISRLGAHVIGETSTKPIWIKTLDWGLKFLLLIIPSCLLVGYFTFHLLKAITKIELENHLAIHDALTLLPNRRYFDEIFPKIQGDCRRSHTPLSVLFIDIDKFKNFNDLHGHECGDRVLQVVAQSILSLKKRPLDFFCRYGGEEFLFILPNTDERGAIHYADEILKAVSSQAIDVNNGLSVHVTVSIGIATDPSGTKNMSDDLIKSADKAMYVAKQSGRNRYEIYSA